MISNVTSQRLQSSILLFGVIAAILSSLIADLVWTLLPGLRPLAIAEVPATVLSSVLFWWLFIVRPRYVTVGRGILVGIASIICALFLMCWFCGIYLIVVQHMAIDLLTLLGVGLLVAFFVSITPLGWFFFLIGGTASGSLAMYLHRSILSEELFEREEAQESSFLGNGN